MSRTMTAEELEAKAEQRHTAGLRTIRAALEGIGSEPGDALLHGLALEMEALGMLVSWDELSEAMREHRRRAVLREEGEAS